MVGVAVRLAEVPRRVFNAQVPSEYRVSPSVSARLMGVVLIAIAVTIFVATALVAVLNLHTAVLLVPAVLGLLVLIAMAVLVSRRGWIVRLGDDGYQVQWVRGVGIPAARWKDVEDAITSTVEGAPVVVLRLRSGKTTTIPVEMLAGDREGFVRDLQQHLQDGQGLRPL